MTKQLKLFPDKKAPADPIDWNLPSNEKVSRSLSSEKKRFYSYEEYIKSEEWKIKRAFALNRKGHRCEKCGRQYKLEVHHKTYDRLYNEKPEDLEVLCPKCHSKADNKRAEEVRFDRGLDTYASKKYGENWGDYMDHDLVAEEFEEWLEWRGDY